MKTKTTSVGDIVTDTTLRKTYGSHAASTLYEFLTSVDRERGQRRKWKVLKTLPSMEEFTAMKVKRFTRPIEDAVGEAFSEYESLCGELQDWYDNLPESFQNGDRGERLQDATNTLENVLGDTPDVPESLREVPVYYVPSEKISSRSDRCSEATAILQSVVDVLDSMEENEDAEQLSNDLANVIGEAEGVEFPGMYS